MVKPNCHGFPPARLLADERRLSDWFSRLDALERRRHYSVAEIREATGIPATRLRVVMYRFGWQRRRSGEDFGLTLFQGPFSRMEQQEREDFVTMLDKITGVSG